MFKTSHMISRIQFMLPVLDTSPRFVYIYIYIPQSVHARSKRTVYPSDIGALVKKGYPICLVEGGLGRRVASFREILCHLCGDFDNEGNTYYVWSLMDLASTMSRSDAVLAVRLVSSMTSCI